MVLLRQRPLLRMENNVRADFLFLGKQAVTGSGAGHGWRAPTRALAYTRPRCDALITPQAVVLDIGGSARPVLCQWASSVGSVEERFGAAVTALLQLIDDSGVRGRRLHAVVSDFWARPLLLPLQGKRPSDEEMEIVIQRQYRATYGDMMSGWHWCWEAQAERLLAVAWPASGLQALRDGLLQRSFVLASAKPLAVDVAAGVLADGGSTWLAIIEQQSVTLVRQQDGAWEDWRVMPADADMAESLPLLLAREAARRGDGCRALTLVDLTASANITRLRSTLSESGWSLRVTSLGEARTSLSCRLTRLIEPGGAA